MSAEAFLDSCVGSEVPGGCDDCDAFQTVERIACGVFRVVVHHDSWCPTLRTMNRERRRHGGRSRNLDGRASGRGGGAG